VLTFDVNMYLWTLILYRSKILHIKSVQYFLYISSTINKLIENMKIGYKQIWEISGRIMVSLHQEKYFDD